MRKQTPALAFAVTLCGLVAAPALALRAAPDAAEKGAKSPRAPEGAATVSTMMVTNARKTDLVELQAAESGSASWKKALGALKAGAHAAAKLPRPFNCRVDLHGTFADGQTMDASGVDVCTQKTLNLTD